MISLSPFLWLNFFVFLAITPFAFSLPIVPLPAPPPSPPPLPAENSKSPPFKPSIAIVVGVLTTLFSITFLVLLYAKHCKRGNGGNSSYRSSAVPPPDLKKNSGIDRTVIESLPVFRFGSLRGHKDGLECSVCLNRFEPNEVLRLLPKCKHGFHVECVDTWLDAHSTCPLCRYRVDPEDVLLVMDSSLQRTSQEKSPSASTSPEPVKGKETGNFRAPGRHSWAGERGSGSSLQIIVENPGAGHNTASFNGRRSLDSWKKKSNSSCSNTRSSSKGKNKYETVSVGCLDKANRKDGLLLADKTDQQRARLEHRIIVSDASGPRYRWSDMEPSDSLYLQSALLFSECRRSSESKRSTTGIENSNISSCGWMSSGNNSNNNNNNATVVESGRGVINGRSVSEISGLSRFRSNEVHELQHKERRRHESRQRQEMPVTTWLAWMAHSRSQSGHPAVRSDEREDALTAVAATTS